MNESYRRTNEPRPLEVEPSTARASAGGDLGRAIDIVAAYELFRDHYRQRTKPWCDLAEWEQEGWYGFMEGLMSYRRTNEPGPLEVEPSTAGATGAGDHGRPMRIIVRHSDHDPALICRPVGYGLCEPYIVKVGCEITVARQGGLNVISAH